MGNNNRASFGVILTLFFPFIGLIYSLTHWRASWAKNAFWIACIYLGAVFIYWPEGSVLGYGADGGRYVLRLMTMYNQQTTLSQIFDGYLVELDKMDLYQPLLTWVISRFTDNGHILFTAFAFVYGFFYSRNIWYILDKLPNKKFGYLIVLVSLYFLILPITAINGVRMWTATHVYVYAMMPYILDRDRSKIWWVLLTPLIHFSFLYVAIFAVVWTILPYRLKAISPLVRTIALVLFVASLFVNTIRLNAVSGVLAEYSPEVYESKIDTYVDEDRAALNAESKALTNWYVVASGNISHWSYSLLLLALIPCLKRNFKNNVGLWHLCVFALFLGSIANIMALVPSGGRFQVLSQMFKVPLILLVAMSIPYKDVFRNYVGVATFFLLIPLVFEIRELFDWFSVTAILGNFMTVFFWENNVPLIDIIKQII